MMQIPCPSCGKRDEPEFVFGGAAHLHRPALSASDREWGWYLYFRDNVQGVALERWRHACGCGQWFNLARDTRTHEIVRVYGVSEPPQ